MKLSAYMTSEGVTAEEMARRLGVHRVAVTRYLNGTRRPSWEVLARMSAATDGSVGAEDFVDAGPSDARPCDTEPTEYVTGEDAA